MLTPTCREKPLPKTQEELEAVEESASKSLSESYKSGGPSDSERQSAVLIEEPQFVTIEEFNQLKSELVSQIQTQFASRDLIVQKLQEDSFKFMS